MSRSIHILTAVWGAQYVERFLSTTLPTVLSANNLPALCAEREAVYRIYTSREDADLIKRSPLFGELRRHVPVIIESPEIPAAPEEKYSRATNYYRLGLRRSAADGMATVMLTPDAIWSNGSLTRVGQLADQGVRAVLVDGLRAEQDAFMDTFKNAVLPDERGVLTVEARPLMKMAMDAIHPYEAALTWGTDMTHDVPFRLHWPVAGEGILSRGFCIHPLYIDPETEDLDFAGAIDHGLVNSAILDRSKIFYADNSDDFAIVSIDAVGFSGQNLKRFGKRGDLLNAAHWAWASATEQNLEALQFPLRRHFGPMSEAKWKRAERLSARHVAAILSCRKLLVFLFKMEAMGLNCAAALLAFALKAGGLTGWLGDPSPKTLLVPADTAFEKMDSSHWKFLLSPEGAGALRALLMAHTVDGALAPSAAETKFPGIKILDAGIEVEDWIIHVIDSLVQT